MPSDRGDQLSGKICQGTSCQGTSCQGTSSQGTSWEGTSCQGANCQGTSWQGTSCLWTSCLWTSCLGAVGAVPTWLQIESLPKYMDLRVNTSMFQSLTCIMLSACLYYWLHFPVSHLDIIKSTLLLEGCLFIHWAPSTIFKLQEYPRSHQPSLKFLVAGVSNKLWPLTTLHGLSEISNIENNIELYSLNAILKLFTNRHVMRFCQFRRIVFSTKVLAAKKDLSASNKKPISCFTSIEKLIPLFSWRRKIDWANLFQKLQEKFCKSNDRSRLKRWMNIRKLSDAFCSPKMKILETMTPSERPLRFQFNWIESYLTGFFVTRLLCLFEKIKGA